MNLERYFLKLFEYELWANKKIFMYLENNLTSKEILDIFSHMVADMKPWIMMLTKQSVPDNIDCLPSWDIQQCRIELADMDDKMGQYLSSVTNTELENKVDSLKSRGQIFTHTVTQVLTQMAIHSQYHRGQIEMLIKKETGIYLPTSYMPYLRQQVCET